MRTSDLKKKYPKQFKEIESFVFDDLRIAKKTDGFKMLESTARCLAFNAATAACFMLHRELKADKKAK